MIHSSKYVILRELELFQKGDFLFQSGDPVQSIFILNKGSVKSGVKTNLDKTLIKEIVYESELIGENVMTNMKVRRAFAQTISDSEFFAIPVSFFKDLLQKNPQLCQELTYILIQKMSNLENRMSNFVFKKARLRIVEFIRELAELKGIKIGHFSARKPHKILVRNMLSLS